MKKAQPATETRGSSAKAGAKAKAAKNPSGDKASPASRKSGGTVSKAAGHAKGRANGSAAEEGFSSEFIELQRQRLLALRDELVDTMAGVARDNLREHGTSGDASAFGMHQADAGSDSYDRDFALHLLSQEQDALYEINEALKRIEGGSYGICESSGKAIPRARLEALPFARLTVECQSQLERENRANAYSRLSGPVFKRAARDVGN